MTSHATPQAAIGTSDMLDRYAAWVREVGAPRVVPCHIDVTGRGADAWVCYSHDFRFPNRAYLLSGALDDRCPVSRLEEWRARRWEVTA